MLEVGSDQASVAEPGSKPEVNMQETAAVLERLLPYFYPRSVAAIDQNASEFKSVVKAALKFEVSYLLPHTITTYNVT